MYILHVGLNTLLCLHSLIDLNNSVDIQFIWHQFFHRLAHDFLILTINLAWKWTQFDYFLLHTCTAVDYG